MYVYGKHCNVGLEGNVKLTRNISLNNAKPCLTYKRIHDAIVQYCLLFFLLIITLPSSLGKTVNKTDLV